MNFVPLTRPATDFQQPPRVGEITAFATRLLGTEIARTLTEITEIGGGAFNNAFRLTAADGRRWVLRISPPLDHRLLFHVEHHLLRREHALTPALAAIPEIASLLPRTVGADFTNEICNRDALLSEFIDGENWDAVMSTLTPAENDSLWRQLAAHLRQIHATPAPHFGWPYPERPQTRWSDFILAGIRGLLDDLHRLNLPTAEATAFLNAAENHTAALDEITQPKVLHGDPWPKNILIHRNPCAPAPSAESKAGACAQAMDPNINPSNPTPLASIDPVTTGIPLADATSNLTSHNEATTSAPRIVAILDHERGGFGDPLQEWVFNGYDFPEAFWQSYGPRPTAPTAQIRAAIYAGTIQIHILLESTRYPDVDTTAPRQHLAATAETLVRL